MTDQHPDELLDLLRRWLPRQRWFPFADGGAGVELRVVAQLALPDQEGAGARILLLEASEGARTELLQVPLTFRAAPLEGAERFLVGELAPAAAEDPGADGAEEEGPAPRRAARFLRERAARAGRAVAHRTGLPLPGAEDAVAGPWVYDGVGDPVFVGPVLELMQRAESVSSGPLGLTVTGAHGDALSVTYAVDTPQQVRVISSEQSNSSVILTPPAGREDADTVIVKFFRVLGEGDNPDVEVGRELTSLGCPAVPSTFGWLDARWRSGLSAVQGQLAVATEFLAGSADAWARAVEAAEQGADFSEEARELGRTTARVHRDLGRAFGSETPDDAARARLLNDLGGRLRWARTETGSLFSEHATALDQLITSLGDVPELPPLQRIHGDYHLGQVLQTEDGQFKVLDFEGEPLRAIEERTRPDVALRDVVGMLRSFDYAAAFGARAGAQDAEEWGRRAGDAFLAGYEQGAGHTVDRGSPLFLALWLDKALYEVVYEQRNRPDWVDVPAAAVRRSLESLRSRSVNPDTAGADPVPGTDHDDDSSRSARHISAEPGTEIEDAVSASTPQDRSDPVQSSRPAPAGHDVAPAGPVPVAEHLLAAVSEGRHHDPHSVLGAHLNPDGSVTVRTLRRFATAVAVVTQDGTFELEHEWGGIFTGVVPAHEPGRIPDYRVDVTYRDLEPQRMDDPYRFGPTLGELDLHLIGEGRHETLWNVLGAHVRRYPSAMGDITGVAFAVWAPNAQAVRVIGDFNGWDGSEHAMRSLGSSGVWEIFVPGLGSGATYKFRILGRDGGWREKADPMAFGTEVPPSTASRVFESEYEFQDDAWMARRATTDPHNAPMSVYELHIGSWRKGLGYKDLAKELVEYLTWQGFTHVEFMPVAEHPFGGSWGYQVTSYYAPSSRFGSPDEFRYLVDKLHQAGIGVLVDWVPGHFPKDEWALARFDGEPLYEHADPRRGEHKDWGTLIPDYGRNEVRNFLVANASYWLEEFHVDGLRVDAVASMLYLDYSRNEGEWEPNVFGGRENLEAIAFLKEANATAYKRTPGIVMIAEESTSYPGVTRPTDADGLGFGLKWNMGWMNDTLEYMAEDPVNRYYHHNKLTFSLVYAFSENFLLPISHDEVVYGKGSLLRKMPGDRWQQLANVRAYLAFMWAHPGKQLIFMGTEYAQESEWSQEHGLDWWLSETPPHKGVQELVRTLNGIYRETPALYERDNNPAGFEWIDAADAGRNTLSFTRWDEQGNPLVCVANFAGNPHENFRLGLPWAGEWVEVLNTDSEHFGGSGVGNLGKVTATEGAHNGNPASVELTVPPLAVLYLKPAEH
ncbi:glycogen branching protein [Kocuria rosea subsp. polaris]|uniref:1,4-alpha-glucan branching enzyme GlgB n=1 Tax=Kocuria rosea subsp. polaris TaxID=136273 RepID=A0A0W8I3S0_KOCRO|nr:1,4-alpha-glucan branching protein GlgB [Kocuria polaris]KUG52215.1 glycogen branching protein [Kocuria polaris]